MGIDITKFNTSSEEEDITLASQYVIAQQGGTSEGRGFQLEYLLNLLNLKKQEKLLKDQNNFNEKILERNEDLISVTKRLANYTKWSVTATWILVIATIIINIWAG